MSDFLAKCEEYYSTRCFYEVLQVNKDATDKEIKKAYHKLSLRVHPDRVQSSNKEIATEKFKVLGKIYSVLQDEERRKVYDDCGEFDEENDGLFNWMEYWRAMFKPITTQEIDDYKREYVGSESEIRDVKKAYVSGKGDMNDILEMVPFSDCDSEPRLIEIVRKLVEAGEVEEYDRFFNEPEVRKDRRRRKWDDERREAEQLKINHEELANEIQKNREKRRQEFANFLTDIERKYGGKGRKRKAVKGGGPAKKKANTSKTAPTKKKRAAR